MEDQDGRVDILALRARYANISADDVLGNEAKGSFQRLIYKNEREMLFEKFQEGFLKSINDLERAHRPMNSADIIDAIWEKVQHPGLTEYIAALQVQQNLNPVTHDYILQSIAIQIPKIASHGSSNRRNLSEVTTGDKRYTKDGQPPKDGVYAEDGAIYIGNYSYPQWNSSSVRPFHQEINKARNSLNGRGGGYNGKGGGYKPRSNRRNTSKVKAARRKLSKLKQEVETLEERKRNVSETTATPNTSTTLVVSGSETQAGTAFGGKNAKRTKPT